LNADGIVGANGGIEGYNMFAYCNNNPIVYSDDSGYAMKPNTVIVNDGSSSRVNSDKSQTSLYSSDETHDNVPVMRLKADILSIPNITKNIAQTPNLEGTLGPYNQLREMIKGIPGLEVHHLIEFRFHSAGGELARYNWYNAPSVIVSKTEHRALTNSFRAHFPYGKTNYSSMESSGVLSFLSMNIPPVVSPSGLIIYVHAMIKANRRDTLHYIRHYNILNAEDTSLADILSTKFNISCENIRLTHTGERYSFIFEVPENHPRFDEIECILPKVCLNDSDYDASNIESQKVYVIYYPVYSEDEYNVAKWLSVRSSFSKIIPRDENAVIQYSCYLGDGKLSNANAMHRSIIDSLLVKKFSSWGKRSFASLSYDESELFCNKQTRDVLIEANINGIKFVSTYSNGIECNDIYRMHSDLYVPNTAIVSESDMEICSCPICNMSMLAYNNTRGTYAIKGCLLDDNVDFYKTPPMFLSAANKGGGFSQTIISQKLYRYIKDNKMDRALYFTPLSTV
jgi:hypothetical protein